MVIVQKLGKILPDQFVAEPRVHLGSQVEIDRNRGILVEECRENPSTANVLGSAGCV